MIHLYFNIIGVLVFLSIFYTANTFIHFPMLEENVSTFGIAIVHTLFNVLATLVMLPFSRLLEKLAYLTIPQDDAPEQFQMLDPRLLATPAVAADRASVTTADMAELARASFLGAIALTHRWNEEGAERVRRQENETDKYEDAIGTYLVKLSTCNLTLKDSHLVNTLLHTISDFERISDHATNLLGTAREIEEKNIVFSAQAQSELIVLEDAVQEIINRTVDCFENNDLVAASRVEPLEQVIDDLVRKIKSRHIARLQTGSCTIEYGFVLDDLLTNYERVADHCSNIAVAMIQVADDSFETHEYLTSVKSGGNENFDQMFREFRGKFRFPDESL